MPMHDSAFLVLECAGGCSRHPISLTVDEIQEPLYGRQWCCCEESGAEPCRSYCDSSGAAVFLLRDGRYATVLESSDTTGHG